MRLTRCPLYTRQRPTSGHCGRSELCQQPTLFDQFKTAGIAAAVSFHRAFQQTVGLRASTYTAALRKRSAYIAEYDISPPSSTNQRGTETAGTRCRSASSAARL